MPATSSVLGVVEGRSSHGLCSPEISDPPRHLYQLLTMLSTFPRKATSSLCLGGEYGTDADGVYSALFHAAEINVNEVVLAFIAGLGPAMTALAVLWVMQHR